MTSTERATTQISGKAQISVIVAAYNAENTILSAIQSALNQTYRSLEVIVVDDASSDKTNLICTSVADPRLSIVRNKDNRGAGPSRDIGISLSTGEWITFLDADDAWEPERLEALLNAMEFRKDTIIFDNIMECASSNGHLIPWRPLRNRPPFHCKTPTEIALWDWILSDRLLIKPVIPTSLIELSNAKHSNRKFAEDTEFFLSIFKIEPRIMYHPKPMYLYRRTSSSASATRTRHDQMIDVLNQAKGFFKDQPSRNAINKKIAMEKQLKAYFDFLDEMKSRQAILAIRRVIHNPALIATMAKRLSKDISLRFTKKLYQWNNRNA